LSLSATAAAATAVLNGNNFEASASAVSPATTERVRISAAAGSGLNFGDYDIGMIDEINRVSKVPDIFPSTPAPTAATSVEELLEDEFYNLSPVSLSMTKADQKLTEKISPAVTTEGTTSIEDEYYSDYFNFYGDGGDDAEYDDEDDDESGQSSSSALKEKKEEEEDKDALSDLPPEIYCDLIDTLEDKCGEYNLLELWKYDEAVISQLTQKDIIDAINLVTKSPVFGYDTDYTSYLGDKSFNSTGHVIGARSIRSVYLTTFDPDLIAESEQTVGIELETADPFTMAWELELIDALLALSDEYDEEESGYRGAIHQFLRIIVNSDSKRDS
jgi:hypothetical protein